MAEPLRLTVPCDEFAPGTVRGELAKLPDSGWEIGDAMLVASELVTNAVRHSLCAEDEFLIVCMDQARGRLRISVRDPGTSAAVARVADRELEFGGMGLRLVAALSKDWGAERHADGYDVWAELQLAE